MKASLRPSLVIVGTAGSGKSTVAAVIAQRCDMRVIEDTDVIEAEYSRCFDDLIVDSSFPMDLALDSAGQRVLRGDWDIVVLSPSQVRSERVLARLGELKEQGSAIVLLQLPIDHAARRVGLNVARLVALGAPRALFAAMTRNLNSVYSDLATFSCDTGENTASEVAENIITACKMATV